MGETEQGGIGQERQESRIECGEREEGRETSHGLGGLARIYASCRYPHIFFCVDRGPCPLLLKTHPSRITRSRFVSVEQRRREKAGGHAVTEPGLGGIKGVSRISDQYIGAKDFRLPGESGA